MMACVVCSDSGSHFEASSFPAPPFSDSVADSLIRWFWRKTPAPSHQPDSVYLDELTQSDNNLSSMAAREESLQLLYINQAMKKKMHTQNSPSNEGCGGPKETEQQSFLEKPVQKPGRKKRSPAINNAEKVPLLMSLPKGSVKKIVSRKSHPSHSEMSGKMFSRRRFSLSHPPSDPLEPPRFWRRGEASRAPHQKGVPRIAPGEVKVVTKIPIRLADEIDSLVCTTLLGLLGWVMLLRSTEKCFEACSTYESSYEMMGFGGLRGALKGYEVFLWWGYGGLRDYGRL
ncbi:hypothetical protein C0Q70_12354 [Pomacea canaliculata]|uniref:Uncharacterized protein n=1 Tax=Pomacea canaliculata TaxID=400727 RepID=A0A2T7P1B4_POMCA|nr:hypothetical protein C0Q70_12354 [Pomacea canaliculata]